ncbi:TIGR03826 family flagellar region protein [Lentibacillus sp. N15]|uniref:TIGR03826 family flagellar region protein n=1 Tax=Lentibacillus songyuanensis TaxID=3136161 RepID=UPI0031BB8B0C
MMAELANCTRCDAVFVKTFRDICQTCYREEEQAFTTVYQFLREQKNREATLPEIVEATGIDEKLIIKFIKEKRLRPSEFPKLAYPCEKCGTNIISGTLCATCSRELLKELETGEAIKRRTKERKERLEKQARVYYTLDQHQIKD